MFNKIIKIIWYWINVFTIPAYIIHELCHYIMCKLVGYHVLEICFFNNKHFSKHEKIAYVTYEFDREKEPVWKEFLIAFAPQILLLPIFIIMYINLKVLNLFYIYSTTIILIALFPSELDIYGFIKEYQFKKYKHIKL